MPVTKLTAYHNGLCGARLSRSETGVLEGALHADGSAQGRDIRISAADVERVSGRRPLDDQGGHDEGVPAYVLSSALYERFSSRGEADFADKLFSAMR